MIKAKEPDNGYEYPDQDLKQYNDLHLSKSLIFYRRPRYLVAFRCSCKCLQTRDRQARNMSTKGPDT